MYVKSLRGNLWNWRNKWHKTPTLCGAACWWCQQQNCNMLFLMQIQPLWCRSAPLFFRVSPLSPSAIVCPSEFTLDSLPLVLTHTHIIPSSGLCLTPAWNQFQSLHPPTPALAPILSHHEARLLLCQPENNPHHHHHLNAPFLSQNPSVLYPCTTGLASVLIITCCSK